MAKKKTENIKAAPVLRAQSGGEQTGTRTYQIMDPWKDRDVVNLVDVKAVDGEITEVKVNGQPAGGGGGGNFRTAQVTFINASAGGHSHYNLMVPTLNIVDLYIEVSHVDFMPENDPRLRPTTVVLGTNGYYGTFDELPTTATATGGVRYDGGDVYITGDGTLTIS